MSVCVCIKPASAAQPGFINLHNNTLWGLAPSGQPPVEFVEGSAQEFGVNPPLSKCHTTTTYTTIPANTTTDVSVCLTPEILHSTHPNTICSSNRAKQHICMSIYASSQPVPHNQDSSTFTITHFGPLCLAAEQNTRSIYLIHIFSQAKFRRVGRCLNPSCFRVHLCDGRPGVVDFWLCLSLVYISCLENRQ